MSDAQSIIDELTPQISDIETDEDFKVVERRINMAQRYKLLLNNTLFDDGSVESLEVEEEIRQFVKGRIKVLLGITPQHIETPKESDFTPEEVEALRELAYRLRSTKILADPVVKEEPKQEVVVPVIDRKRPGPKPGIPRKPGLRKTIVPNELRTTSAPPAAPKPPVNTAPIDPNNDPEKFNPITGALRKRENGRLMEQIVDPRNGKVRTTEAGQEMWADVTPAPKPGAGYIPPPTPQVLASQLEAAANNQAMGIMGVSGVVSGAPSLGANELAGIVDLMRNS